MSYYTETRGSFTDRVATLEPGLVLNQNLSCARLHHDDVQQLFSALPGNGKCCRDMAPCGHRTGWFVPKPVSSNPNAPPFPEYNLGINYTSSLQVDAPHIVSFIRASQQAVSITFSIEDSNGQEVVPETTVQLQEFERHGAQQLQVHHANPSGRSAGKLMVRITVHSVEPGIIPNCGELWGNMSLGASA